MAETKKETARVDPAATRRRLASFIGAEGYKPELLVRVARLSIELKEPVQAGRYWLLSDAAGDDVDAAVEAFAASCHKTARLMASELPRFARDWDLEMYPAPARARIEKYGLGEELARRRPKKQPEKKSMTAVAVLGLFALLAFAAVLVLLRR